MANLKHCFKSKHFKYDSVLLMFFHKDSAASIAWPKKYVDQKVIPVQVVMPSRPFSKFLLSNFTTLQKSLKTIEKPLPAPLDTNKNDEKEKHHKWWHTSREFKVISSIAVGIASYILNAYHDRKKAIKDVKLEHVNAQLKCLYGPLYGNRLVQEKTYRAVMGELGGLKEYLKKARETNDAEMLRRWRCFMYEVLYPLDVKAEELLSKNSHLIADQEFPKAFDHFLNHIARLKFVMERWKTNDGKLEPTSEFTPDDFLEENNASGDRGVKEMLKHVEQRYKELREMQKRLKIEVQLEENGDSVFNHLMKKL